MGKKGDGWRGRKLLEKKYKKNKGESGLRGN